MGQSGVGLALAAACLALGLWSCGGRSAPAPAPAPQLAAYVGTVRGDRQAPVVVEAILPVNNGCQDALGLYLVDLATRNPSLLQVHTYDMKSPEGRALMASKGIKCACVLVQGTTKFDLGGDTGKVLLEGPMDPFDVHKVLQHYVRTLAGSPVVLPDPPDDCSAPSAEERRKAGF
jgi:hypothetical protein